jgi:hypothetical protein
VFLNNGDKKMKNNEESAMNENDGDKEEKNIVFLMAGQVWTSEIFIDWDPESSGKSAAFDGDAGIPTD